MVFTIKVEEAFGKVVRKERTTIGISQEELALTCNLDRTFISMLERGKRKPTLTTIFALSVGLKVRPRDLVSATEEIINSEVN